MINLKDTYILAIQNEIKAQVLYEFMSKSFQRLPEASVVFKELITMEKLHEEKLRVAFKYEFPNNIPDLDANQKPQLKSHNITEPQKILEYAIAREIEAGNTYHKMALEATNPDVIELLKKLAIEEEYHQTILETEIQRLHGMMTWFDPSELNGLVED